MTTSQKLGWFDYARIVSGVLCLAAGIAKAFPQIEDIAQVLRDMAAANAGSILAAPSEFIVANLTLTTGFVGVALAASGLAFLFNRFLFPAAIGQLVMFACFVIMLFQFQPAIIAIDLPFILIAALVLRREMTRRAHQSITREIH